MPEISREQPIARGRTADVYAWEEGHILKLFHTWFAREDVEYEQKIARAVHASGVRSPAVGDLIQIQGRNGLIYELIRGKSMLAMFQQKPWQVFRFAKTFAALHAQMHGRTVEAAVPAQKIKLQKKIKSADALPVYLKPKVLDALTALPEGDRVCHGDFHPDNILISENDATVIDWIDASRGNPLADVARTSIILLGAAASTQVANPLLKVFVRTFHTSYVRRYFHLRPGGEKEYRRWLPIVAAARLNENIHELESWLVTQAKQVEAQ